jgi:hypothetical protein
MTSMTPGHASARAASAQMRRCQEIFSGAGASHNSAQDPKWLNRGGDISFFLVTAVLEIKAVFTQPSVSATR